MLQESVFICMNIVNIINEVIAEVLAYGEITLEEAQRYYGSLVPWVLGKEDLKIINSGRRQYFQDRDKLFATTYKDKQEVAISQLWDRHKQLIADALWKKAQLGEVKNMINEEIKSWYHGTPDVRDIQKVGAFTPRTDTTTYVTDPQKWNEVQAAMQKARSEGNDDLYHEYLNQAGELVKNFTYKKPIYFTGNRGVARTYSDPRRSFDYANAEPSVLNVKIDDSGKILTIPAYGETFRGINSDIVKKALIDDGVPEETINGYYAMFPFWITNGRMTAETLGIIAQLLHYDIVDVLGVKDSYHAGSIDATVRMVFDPSRIKIN